MKKYWKIAAAAVFLTAAGVVFWLTGGTGVSIERLEEGILMEGELPEGGNGEVSEMESGLEDFSGDDGAAGETAAAGGKNGGLSGADGISEDEIKEYQDDVQKSTDKYVAKIDAAVEEKSKEILTV